MKQVILTLILFLSFANIEAKSTDSTRRVDVGDSVFISSCINNTYQHIQYYRKTRFPNPNATYNKTTCDDFYEYFFLDGDFDVKTLPCEFGDKKYKIISIRVFADKKTGLDRPVMFLDLGLNTVAWVELNGAVENLEIYLQ
jgi:hypothetical protein